MIHETEDGLMVYLTRNTDDDADVSHYGEFTDKILERFYFDRSSGELRDSDRTIEEDGEESHVVVADIPTRGREYNSYEYTGAFQLGWELDDKSKSARKAFKESTEQFRKLGIKPKRCKGRRSGYWMAVLCMAQDAKRLEDYANGYWCMEFVRVEVRDENDEVLASDSIGGIESDDESFDAMKEYFSLETLLKDARLARGDVRETLMSAGQLELVI